MSDRFERIGFIGLGVMGEPICRNLARKTGLPVTGIDPDPGPPARLAADGVNSAASVAEGAAAAELTSPSLPPGVVCEAGSLLSPILLFLVRYSSHLFLSYVGPDIVIISYILATVDVSHALLAVSYPHLTLPTNREV